jgi:hypothetical protein
MAWGLSTITDLGTARDEIRRRRYGVIATAGGKLQSIQLRPWPTLFSLRDLWPVGDDYHARGPEDHCWLYYNQPRSMPNFLALKYIVSTRGTSFATLQAAVFALERIAELKRTDAIVCDAANTRVSDRLLARFGWEPHKPERWHRNYIRRFYGSGYGLPTTV